MQKAIEIAEKISKELEKNWLPELELINLHTEFEPLYHLGYSQRIANTIICFIIFAYDNDSKWLDVRKDRTDNKEKILYGLRVNPDDPIFGPILSYQNDEVQHVIQNYLINQTDASFYEAISLYDYASKMMRFGNTRTKDKIKTGQEVKEGGALEDIFEMTDDETIAKVNKAKGELLTKAIEAREKADLILEAMRKKYMGLDAATQADFNFTFTDVNKKADIYSWRQFIKENVVKKPV